MIRELTEVMKAAGYTSVAVKVETFEGKAQVVIEATMGKRRHRAKKAEPAQGDT